MNDKEKPKMRVSPAHHSNSLGFIFSKKMTASFHRPMLLVGGFVGFILGFLFSSSLHKADVYVINGRKNGGSSQIKSINVSATEECLDLQVDNSMNNRSVPLSSERDKCLVYQPPPSDFVKTVMNFVVGAPNQGKCAGGPGGCSHYSSYVEEERLYGNDWPPFGYTMIGKKRLEQFRASIHEVDRNQIKGAIIEMGVWRGGAMIMAAAVTKEARSDRDLFLYDAFESIPGYGYHISFLENSEEDVKGYFDLFSLLDKNVHFIKGLFKDTVPKWQKGTPIAVLRIDGNFYDSYSDALYSMYDDVAVGGIVIFDDVMSHPAVMKCWLDFKADQGLVEELNRIDFHSAWFRKKINVKIDTSKKHPPQDVNKEA